MVLAFEKIQRGSGKPAAAVPVNPIRQRSKPGSIRRALGKLAHRAFSALAESPEPARRELPREYFRFPPF
jgi:hypothetical protein